MLDVAASVAASGSHAQAFDQGHAAWTALLRKHVVPLRRGQASQVRYDGFKADRVAPQVYRDSLSAVSKASFKAFDKPQQMAYPINAYNAFTVELILTKYPGPRIDQGPRQRVQQPLKTEAARLATIERRRARGCRCGAMPRSEGWRAARPKRRRARDHRDAIN